MRLVARVAGWILLVVMATAALVLVVPILRGEPSRLLIVSGHSMDPTFHTGDLVLAWPGSGYDVGDIAPYRVPEGEPGAGGLVHDETHFLNALHEIVAENRTPADELLEKFHGEWNGDLNRIYGEYSY